MTQHKVSAGTVHNVPKDMQELITSLPKVHGMWEDITPLARNEWICWITSAKQQETRERRMRIMSENLLAGKRRPCCWAGCGHR
ncbi:MAG TPA: YdeI/OmpD-associated family protein [Candidatus Paceibacterota bacterium]|nr:YdeI/OmpD-associated family protein [Candidatus Paceibacterota bacterium]